MAITQMLSNAMGKVGSIPGIESVGSLLLAGRGRTIMGLFADVTIEEKHKDELKITEHPTEVGAPISDHAYKEPPEVQVKIGWSESAGKLNGLVGNSILSETVGLVAIYEILQQLQNAPVLLIVSTGKRLYTNMLIKSLGCTTDNQTENVLMIDITFRKVLLTSTSETEIPLEEQSEPEATSSAVDNGTVQTKEANQSVLSSIFGGQTGGTFKLGW